MLTGYYSSRVEGVDPNVPVTIVDCEGRANRAKPQLTCEWLHRYVGTSYGGGPAAMVLSRRIEGLTGRQLDRIRGGYALNSVEIR